MPKSRGRKSGEEENWFLVAASEAENTDKAKLVAKLRAEREAELDRIGASMAAMGAASTKTTAALREAAETFAAVGSGARPAYIAGTFPLSPQANRHSNTLKPITPEQGLNAIIAAVAGAGDADAVMKAGGEWMTRVTNKITEAIRNADAEE